MSDLKKILLLNASPRKGGNIDIILDKLIESFSAAAQAEKIYINDLDFKPCQGCGGCDGGAECVLEDELRPLYQKLIDAKAIILGSPIYFGSLSAQAKMFIDRMQPFWTAKLAGKGKNLKSKKAFLILVAGSGKSSFFENAKEIAKNFFNIINARYCGELFFEHIDEKGEISDFPGLKSAAEKLARLALVD